MAITRAQQVKQMLREGGRIGFKGGADAATVGFDKSYDERAGTDDRPRSVEISPTGGVKTSKDAPDPVDDRGNFLQNRNQQNITEYNKNLKKIEENKNLNFIEKFNAKKRLKNKVFIDRKFTEKAVGIANAYGLSVDQLENLLDAYDRDEDPRETFKKMQDVLDMDPSARNLGQDFNEGIMKGALGSIELSPGMKKGRTLSTAELFSTTDPTTRIELPGVLGVVQPDANFSNVISGLNRLKTLDEISKTPGGVKQSDIDNYFNLTMGKGGIDPITKKPVDALFPTRDDDGPSQITDPCKGPNPPAYCFIGDKADDTQKDVITRNLAGLTPRMGGSIFDFTNMAEGGLAEMDREAFLLGGIAKGLKKAVRGVKKIAKSPIGKAALGLAAFKFGPAIFGKGSLNPFLRTVAGDTAFSPLGSFLSKYGLVSKAGLPTFKGGIALASILPLLVGKTDEEKDDILKEYYASQELTPATTARQAGSEFDFYNYNLAEGGTPRKEPVAKKVMPLLDMGGMEKDYRAEGGFVPIGRMEKADDVPARLSKNEFVFTADAVRNAGDGDVDKGAEVMYNMMKNLEAGGEVSEESQGLEGAREMFQTSQRLGEVI